MPNDHKATAEKAQVCTDHEKCCRFLLCSHPACCGYYGKVLNNPPAGSGS